MILLDVNVLLMAKMSAYPDHAAMRSWLQDRLNAPARCGMPWVTLLGFSRLASNPRVFQRPLTLAHALRQVEEWLALPNVWTPQPTDQHASIVGRLAVETSASYRLVTDLHLAALAIEHGVTLCSRDQDFRRFPELRWTDPLAG